MMNTYDQLTKFLEIQQEFPLKIIIITYSLSIPFLHYHSTIPPPPLTPIPTLSLFLHNYLSTPDRICFLPLQPSGTLLFEFQRLYQFRNIIFLTLSKKLTERKKELYIKAEKYFRSYCAISVRKLYGVVIEPSEVQRLKFCYRFFCLIPLHFLFSCPNCSIYK